VLVVAVSACGDTRNDVSASAPGEPLEGNLTVAAASSLRVAFEEIGESFRRDHPGVEVTFTFDGSSALATQVLEGAPVDVFASADEASLGRVDEAGLLASSAVPFARNGLVIVTQPGNPAAITGLADLPQAGVVSLCGAEVPCGRYAEEALRSASVTLDESRVSRAPNVAAALTAVTAGDAIAAIVYVTDAAAAGDAVHPVAIPPEHDAEATYPIAALGPGDGPVARAFVDYVLGADGQRVLARHGFRPAP
jgi:molybdate transport system substrate-binding protein